MPLRLEIFLYALGYLSPLNSDNVGKCSKKLSSFSKNTIQLMMILLADATEIPKTFARTVIDKLWHNLTSVRTS
jgi:hypothetical protein